MTTFFKIIFPFIILVLFGCKAKPSQDLNTEKLINVIEKGVVPDGKTDIYPILKNLFDTAPVGSKFYFPKGVYSLSTPLIIDKAEIEIYGDGASSKIVFDNSKDWYAHYRMKRLGMINVLSNGVTFRNLQFDQNFRNSGKKDGDIGNIGCIGVGGKYLGKPIETTNLTVENCKFYDYYCDAIGIFNANTKNLIVKNNTFISAYVAGRWTTADVKGEQALGVASVQNALIENNKIEGALDDAIAIHTFSKNVKIFNNTITTTGGRILMNGTENGEIKGNKITYVQDGGTGIVITFEDQARKISTNNDINVENNEIVIEKGVYVESGIFLCGFGNNVVVKDNIISNKNNEGVGILITDRKWTQTGEYFFGENLRISNNQIIGFSENIKTVISDPKFESSVADIKSKNIEVAKELRELGENTKPRITRIGKKSKKVHLGLERGTNNYFSTFLIPQGDLNIIGVKILSNLTDNFSFRIIDVTHKEKIFTEKSTTNSLQKLLSMVTLKAETEYRITIVTKESLGDLVNITLSFD